MGSTSKSLTMLIIETNRIPRRCALNIYWRTFSFPISSSFALFSSFVVNVVQWLVQVNKTWWCASKQKNKYFEHQKLIQTDFLFLRIHSKKFIQTWITARLNHFFFVRHFNVKYGQRFIYLLVSICKCSFTFVEPGETSITQFLAIVIIGYNGYIFY